MVLLILAAVLSVPFTALAQTAGGEPPAAQTVASAPAGYEAAAVAADAVQDEGEPRFRLAPYGYIKLDASYDGMAISTGNFARWVANPVLETEHGHFNITARQTRLGLRVHGPEEKSFQVMGRVEIDFYGGGGENKNGVMLRHAYIQVDWDESDLTLVAGQTSDLISPLVPRTVNYTVAWWVGNIGYRRPMAAVHKRFSTSGGQRLTLTGGISRTIGDDFKPSEPGDAGADSGIPALQGRTAFAWGMGGRNAEIGFSGHWGKENVGNANGNGHDLQLDSWSANLDIVVPVSSVVAIKGEAFTGRNLDDYFGGIAQGINFSLETEIETKGGWVAVDIDPTEKVQAGFGFAIEDPDDSQLSAGNRSRNQAIWGNLFYNFTDYLKTAGEVSYWTTDYKDEERANAWRYQHTLILTF